MKTQFTVIYSIKGQGFSDFFVNGVEVSFNKNYSALQKTNQLLEAIANAHNNSDNLRKEGGVILADEVLIRSVVKLN